jgi:acetyltransferase-like isoleucine patch superfamily enzyme
MNTQHPLEPDHRWLAAEIPANVSLGNGVTITGAKAFSRFFGTQEGALQIGEGSIMDGVRFGVGESARLTIGRNCQFSDAVLLAEDAVTIGDRVMLGWNVTVADADFHPLEPDARRLDAEAISPIPGSANRPQMTPRPVFIGDDTWIGPNAVVLKGVTIAAGCFIEPGSVVVNDIPARSRVVGNPALVVETL